jgi:hypothetical protein
MNIKMEYTTIGDIGNYYGQLNVKVDSDKYFWSIENHSGFDWEEIPKTLYDECVKFEETRDKTAEGTFEAV